MKRRHQGWPPLTSAKHATRNAEDISRAIRDQDRARELRRCRTSPSIVDPEMGECIVCDAAMGENCRQPDGRDQ